jgi:hypothetical protein
MEKMAMKILSMIDSVRYTVRDIDALAWYLVYNSDKPMRRRLLILADAIVHYHNEEKERFDDDRLWD